MSRNVVITHLLTSTPDPLRGGHQWAPDTPIDQLHRSLVDCRLVVLHDRYPTPNVDLADGLVSVELVKVDPGVNPYWHRWRVTADWLEDNDEVDRVWCVDATDVVMLNPPWSHMQPGELYVGSEDKLLGEPYDGDTQTWLCAHCPSLGRWLAANANRQVLNVGLVGGPPRLVAELGRLLDKYEILGDTAEMGWFNLLVHTFEGPWRTGAPVHSSFLTNARSGPYWWAHK